MASSQPKYSHPSAPRPSFELSPNLHLLSAWQTSRNRNSVYAPRTPQSRSGTASPNLSSGPGKQQQQQQQHPQQQQQQQQAQPTTTTTTTAAPAPAPAPATAAPAASDSWAQRAASLPSSNNGPQRISSDQQHHHLSFNASEVLSFLSRDLASAPLYRFSSDASPSPQTQPQTQGFFVQLAKQVSAVEGGGG